MGRSSTCLWSGAAGLAGALAGAGAVLLADGLRPTARDALATARQAGNVFRASGQLWLPFWTRV